MAISQNIANSILIESGFQCVVCKSSNAIQIHHIDHDRSNNNPDNLVTLCANHHNQAHTQSTTSRNLTPVLLNEFKKTHNIKISDNDLDPISKFKELIIKYSQDLLPASALPSAELLGFGLSQYHELNDEEQRIIDKLSNILPIRKEGWIENKEFLRRGSWDTNKLYFNCPHCDKEVNGPYQRIQSLVTIDSVIVTCPNCGQCGMIEKGTPI